MIYINKYESPIGPITLASDGEAITGLWFDGQKYDRDILRGREAEETELPVFGEARKWLNIYFSGKDPGFTPALHLSGSPFRQMVGEIMLTIPFGKTMTYGEIAKEVARKTGRERMSAQAVGGAVGHNPISVIVPCHRVVGTNGSLTGYAGGVSRKEFLLKNEGIDPEAQHLYLPKKGTAL